MRRFWVKILLVVPIPLLVIGFNWFIDPVHLRSANQHESGIARLILAGKHVTNLSHYNDETLVRLIVDGWRVRKDVLVFGSSRSKPLRSDSFPSVTMFNNSIDGAGLTNYLDIYQMYRQKGLIPGMVIIELSPWILELTAGRLHFNNSIPVKVTEFLSPRYFQTSFFTWWKQITKSRRHAKAGYHAWDGQTLPEGGAIMADGSTLFPEHIQNIRERARILAMAVEFGQKPVGIPQTLDPDGKIKLNTFLDMLQHDGVQPVLFVPPYHPQAYKLMLNSEKSRIIVEEQKYFEALAKRRGLTLVGSYNPSDLALTETDFHDGSHPRADAIRRIFVGRVSLAKIVGTTPATGTANRMELIGIDNANGLETVNGRPFFWIGGGDSCLSLHCATNGTALLGFCASAGPSLPETSERLLLLRTESSFSRLIRINDNPNVEVTFPVRHGLNRVYLTPLDKPTAKTLSNGDPRTLLVGVSGLSVKLLPDAAVIREADQFTLRLTTGWYGVEHSGEDWWAWSTGRGQISVFSKKAGSVILTGALGSASHPNIIDVFVNGIKADTWSPSEYGPTGIPPVHFALNIGENIIEFVSQKPAVTLPTDKRLLAIMVKNLGILEN